MRNLRLASNIQLHLLLDHAIGVSDPLVLTQVFEPRFDQESFEETAFLGGVFEYAPRVGAVPTAFKRQFLERGEECLAIAGALSGTQR